MGVLMSCVVTIWSRIDSRAASQLGPALTGVSLAGWEVAIAGVIVVVGADKETAGAEVTFGVVGNGAGAATAVASGVLSTCSSGIAGDTAN